LNKLESLGKHILVDFYDCDPHLLNDVVYIEKSMEEAARASNATLINSTFHHFSPYGVSGVIVIQESHLAIHTWPEYGFASVDLFTCGNLLDPWISFDVLRKGLKAAHQSAIEMRRGQPQMVEKKDVDLGQLRDSKTAQNGVPRSSRDIWFTERNENLALSFKHEGEKLYDVQSPYQKIEVYKTLGFGNMLTLDGLVMCTEEDEYVYHEMIAHVPMLTHPAARKVLVIGGGDGGTVRELLKHPQLEEVHLVEIDEKVIEASKKFFPKLSVAFEDPKLTIKIEDGIDYIKNLPPASYDLVIVDSTDPVGPGEGLFTREFYQDIYSVLNPDGLMITQSESPRFNQRVFSQVFSWYREIFGQKNVNCYLAFIPTFPTGMWSFSYCSKGGHDPVKNLDVSGSNKFSANNQLQYYNGEVHQAAFALPNFVNKLLEEGISLENQSI